MVKIERITEMKRILELLAEQQFDENIKRYRSPFLYRGLPNINYQLNTSLRRNCKKHQDDIARKHIEKFF